MQAGYFVIPDELQPYIRYQFLDDDANENINIIGAGFNWYFQKHALKFSADAVYVISGNTISGIPGGNVSTAAANTGAADGLGFANFSGEGQIIFRTQLQLLF